MKSLSKHLVTGNAFALALRLLLCPCAAEVVGLSGRFTVDMTPPAAPVLIEPVEGGTVASPFVRLGVSAEDALSGVSAYHFEVTGGDSVWTDYPQHILRALPDETYTWKCRARDRAGNIGEWSLPSSFSYQFGDDQDMDGLPDSWEAAVFGRLTFSDGTADSDEDGLDDSLEAELDTHPFEFELSLRRGWNLLALPCSPSEEECAELKGAVVGGILWSWGVGGYSRATPPQAFRGFWAYAREERRGIRISGVPPESNEIALSAGWSLRGSGFPATVPDTTDVDSTWLWTEDRRFYSVPFARDQLRLSPMMGYWFKSGTGGSITVLREWADGNVRQP